MQKSTVPGSARAYANEFRSRVAMQTNHVHDPFSVNPIRRSLAGVVGSLAIMIVPFLVSDEAGATMMLAVGWLAMAILVFSLPVLIWATVEEVVTTAHRRLYPPVSDLDLSERVVHILERHGIRTIRAAEALDPAAMHLMGNMAPRDVQDVQRAITLWRYRRWQNAGFPAEGAD